MQEIGKKPPFVILAGPTAVGKTKLSIELAKAINGEIISADSMQVYQYMDIGSAKVTKEEMQGIKHYMIDELEPTEDFNVVLFQNKAKAYMKEIYEKGKIPILVGGTGFYIQAVLYDINFTENEEDASYRKHLTRVLEEKGRHYLHEQLKQVDEKAAEVIHENNTKRVIRALEFYKQTGEKISEHNEEEKKKESPYNFYYFVLNDLREQLYERIDKRVDEMLKQGLVAEVKRLKDMGLNKEMVSMQGLGYKEILAYLAGEITLEEAVYILKRDTRHFAKRQITWFKREKEVLWINKNEFGYDDKEILRFMKERITKNEQ